MSALGESSSTFIPALRMRVKAFLFGLAVAGIVNWLAMRIVHHTILFAAAILAAVHAAYSEESAPKPAPAFPAPKADSGPISILSRQAQPPEFRGKCPTKIRFSWRVTTKTPARVSYQILRSDNASAPLQALDFAEPGWKEVQSEWNFGADGIGRMYSGWQALKIVAPHALQSEKIPFRATCEMAGAAKNEPARVTITRASCQRFGVNSYRIDLAGDASGAQGVFLAAGVPNYLEVSQDLRCTQWNVLRAVEPRCQREASQPAATGWTLSLTVHASGGEPSLAAAHLYDTDPARRSATPLLSAKESVRCR
jgi:hypothetical protein